MKQKLLLKMLIVTVFFTHVTQAQKTKLDCESNYRQALFYLKDSKKYKQDSIVAIEFLKPCLKIGHPKAQMLMGKLHSAKKNNEDYKIAFKLLKKSAKQGNVYAMTDLGIMYKYGRGTNINLNKARKWFKKAAKLGDSKATYALGYLYLKGFGNINQSYVKAVKWFKESTHPMAKYWLGVCYYHGYGVSKNKEEANRLLGTNFKESIIDKIDTSNNEEKEIQIIANKITNKIGTSVSGGIITNDNLYGKWSGELLKFDWSGKNIIDKYPLNLEFKYDSIKEMPVYEFNIDNSLINNNYSLLGDDLYFNNLNVELSHESFNEKIPHKLVYNFLSGKISVKEVSKSNYLIGELDTYIPAWNEQGSPMMFVLKKKTSILDEIKISDEILESLAKQEDSFIKLYPNPFERDLIISYTLKSSSYVKVTVLDIKNGKELLVEKGKQQSKGKHSYLFNGAKLEKGTYIVTVIANNLKKTRIIIKK